MRVVVTGAAGFLGRDLVRALRADGHEVLPMVRAPLPSDPEGARSVADVLAHPASLDDADAIVHAAAVRHRHGTTAGEYRASNVTLLESLLRAAGGRVRRFVHVSSVGVYGFPERLPIDETFPAAPVTSYSESKVQAERLLLELAPQLGLEHVIVRPTIVYGAGDTNGMLDKLARMIRRRTYFVVGDGSNTLHHTYIDDITRGIMAAAMAPSAAGDDFILAGPETTTLLALSELVARQLGEKIHRVQVPLRFARSVASVMDGLGALGLLKREPTISHEKLDVMCKAVAFDASKAAKKLGIRPRVGYAEGIARALAPVYAGGR